MLKKLGLDNTILAAKLAESLKSTLPVVAIVFAVCFIFIPVPAGALLAFVFGSILLVVGVGLFTIGVDMAMTPIGSHIGSAVTKSRSLMFALFISFLVGTFVTVSEPDLQVLAGQVPSIPNPVIIGAVALGVGIFLAVAMLRIFLGISLRTLLLVTYPIIIALAFFMPADYIGVAFDSGGVTTGPMTVPFIIALGVGVASSRSDSDAQNDSFGLVAISSIGPILAVMILGVLYPGGGSDYTPVVVPEIADSLELWRLFASEFPHFFHEVALALAPIIVFFIAFQIFKLRLHGTELMQIVIGIFYTYIGLVLFLTGVNAGFLPVGNYLGQLIGALEYNWVIVPLGMVIGYFIVQAEPAVHVHGKGAQHQPLDRHRNIRRPRHAAHTDGAAASVAHRAGLRARARAELLRADDIHRHRLRLGRRRLGRYDGDVPDAARDGALHGGRRQCDAGRLRRGRYGRDDAADYDTASRSAIRARNVRR